MIKYIAKFFYIITSIISIFICLFNQSNIPNGYEYIVLMPLVFLLFFIIIHLKIIDKNKYLITVYSFITISFIRMVLSPLFSVISGYYKEADYGVFVDSSLRISIWLIIYEYIICSVFLMIIISKAKKTNLKFNIGENNYHLTGSKFVYLCFIILGIIVYAVWGFPEGLVKFVMLSSEKGVRYGDNTNSISNLITQIIKIALICIFLGTVSFCKRRYEISHKEKYIDFSLFVALVNVSLIVGERRTMILFTGIASIIVLLCAFPGRRRKVMFIVGVATLAILLMMTIYKSFYAGVHDSYKSAIESANVSIEYLSQTLQAYFVGPHNVSITIEMNNLYPADTSSYIFDFLRSTFGLNFFLKNGGILTSAKFNSFFYGSSSIETGHILSSIGYGYYYFGFVLSPIFTCIHILLSKAIERRLYLSNSFESLFLLSYLLSRLISCMFYNTPSIISFITMNISTMGLVFFVSKVFRKMNKGEVQLYVKTNNVF